MSILKSGSRHHIRFARFEPLENAALTALDADQRAHVAVEAQPRAPEQFFRHRAKRFIGHVAYTAGLGEALAEKTEI